jgi:outer membrane receptor for ferric coprogen and ferric-rhodotorulic acid
VRDRRHRRAGHAHHHGRRPGAHAEGSAAIGDDHRSPADPGFRADQRQRPAQPGVGINVEKVETDRTYFNSRGFDITNFQVDGIGLPLIWGIQFGDLDTALFDRVEAVRGANAIMTGTAIPSATINYVRKRPTDTLQASASAQYGSWDQKRSRPTSRGRSPTGTVAARLIYAHEDKRFLSRL